MMICRGGLLQRLKKIFTLKKLKPNYKVYSWSLKTRSMRSSLIFKRIPEESKKTWGNTSQLIAGFITENLNLPYSFDQMDIQISRAHRTNDTDSSRRKNKSEPRPITA